MLRHISYSLLFVSLLLVIHACKPRESAPVGASEELGHVPSGPVGAGSSSELKSMLRPDLLSFYTDSLNALAQLNVARIGKTIVRFHRKAGEKIDVPEIIVAESESGGLKSVPLAAEERVRLLVEQLKVAYVTPLYKSDDVAFVQCESPDGKTKRNPADCAPLFTEQKTSKEEWVLEFLIAGKPGAMHQHVRVFTPGVNGWFNVAHFVFRSRLSDLVFLNMMGNHDSMAKDMKPNLIVSTHQWGANEQKVAQHILIGKAFGVWGEKEAPRNLAELSGQWQAQTIARITGGTLLNGLFLALTLGQSAQVMLGTKVAVSASSILFTSAGEAWLRGMVGNGGVKLLTQVVLALSAAQSAQWLIAPWNELSKSSNPAIRKFSNSLAWTNVAIFLVPIGFGVKMLGLKKSFQIALGGFGGLTGLMGLMIYNTSLADAFLKKHGVVNFKDLGEANGAYFVKMRDRCLLNLESSLKKQSFFIQVEGRLTFQELPELMQFIQNDPDGECRV